MASLDLLGGEAAVEVVVRRERVGLGPARSAWRDGQAQVSLLPEAPWEARVEGVLRRLHFYWKQTKKVE